MTGPFRGAAGAQRPLEIGGHVWVDLERCVLVAGRVQVAPIGGGEFGDAGVAVIFADEHEMRVASELAQEICTLAGEAAIGHRRTVARVLDQRRQQAFRRSVGRSGRGWRNLLRRCCREQRKSRRGCQQ
jgi:hypothetical protein